MAHLEAKEGTDAAAAGHAHRMSVVEGMLPNERMVHGDLGRTAWCEGWAGLGSGLVRSSALVGRWQCRS